MDIRPGTRVCFLTRTKETHAHDKAILNGLDGLGINLQICRDTSHTIRGYLDLYKNIRSSEHDVILVEFYGRILTIIARLATRKPVIYNAVNAFTDAIVVSRGHSRFGWRAIVAWLADFIEFRCADIVLVETQAQAKYCSRILLLPQSKFMCAWTGADNKFFFQDPSIQKLKEFTVLFRGAFLPESGITILMETARILKNYPINFRVIGRGMLAEKVEQMINKDDLTNIEWVKERLPDDELRLKMAECHISLGQLASHPRLERTIPHKAYESLALGLPYLTARVRGILELLREDWTCVCFKPGDAEDLARVILYCRDNLEGMDVIGNRGHDLFEEKLNPRVIARQIFYAIS